MQKAITSATKYAYLKFFMIPITEDDDNDSVVQEPIRSHQKVTAETAAEALRNRGWELFSKIGGNDKQFKQLEFKIKDFVPVGNFLVTAIHENGCADLQQVYDYAISAFKIDTPFIIGGTSS